jgi:alanine racemase
VSGRLTVSLSALAANYRLLRANACSEVAAVVKADGYGLGAAPIASRLRQEGCDEFFVATCGEGVQLRQALPQSTIYVFEGAHAQSIEPLLAAQLTPVLNTPAQCRLWASTDRNAAVHVDTGMQRLGLPYAQATQILRECDVRLQLLISHFARADETDHATLHQQTARMAPIFASLRESHPRLRLSLCNSAALLQGLGPEDLGRAGIGLYGGNPFDDQPNPMQTVLTMHARVLQVRDVDAGVPVGYGGTYVTSKPTRLAVLGAGYADGLPRSLSNRGHVWLAGQRCPIVGRVSMDLMAVDASAVAVGEGDEAEIIGAGISVDEVAAQADTIAYEILTGISRRMPRTYVD